MKLRFKFFDNSPPFFEKPNKKPGGLAPAKGFPDLPGSSFL